MKKIFSNVFLIFIYPTKLFKKIKINNFLGGIILGAIVTLIVNVATVQVQEEISKQRILEAVENEILSNLILSNNVLTFNNKSIEDKTKTNYLYTPRRYSRDLWEQSTEPLQYIAQLPMETQNKIAIYYSFTVPSSNALVEKIDYMTKDKIGNCTMKLYSAMSTLEQNDCRTTWETLLIFEQTPAKWISEGSFELLKIFHPTKDRLNNFFLRLIMGGDSTRPLSGK